MLAKATASELNNMIEAIGMPVFVVDVGPDRTVRYAALNQRLLHLTGFCAGDICGCTPDEAFPAQMAAAVEANYWRCIDTRSTVEYDECLDLPAGSRWWHTVLAPVFDPGGRVIRILGTATDITDQRLVNEALRYRNALLDAQQETLPDGVLVADEFMRMRSWNRNFVRMWNLSEEVMAARDGAAAVESVLAQLEDPDAFVRKIDYLYRNMDEVEQGVEITLKDGRIFERYSSGLVDDNGHIWGRAWFYRDITARKAVEGALKTSEQRLQEAQTIAHIGSWQFDMRSDTLWWSREAYRLFDRNPAQGPPALADLQAQLHPEDLPRWKQAVGSALRQGRPFRFEFRARDQAGDEICMEACGRPLRDERGRLIGVTGTVQDISERRRVDRLKDEFISVVSHELRTPLTSIIGGLGLMKGHWSQSMPEAAATLLDIARDNSDRLLRLINDILDLSKLESGDEPRHFEALDLGALLRASVEANEGYAHRLHTRIELVVEDELLWVHGERDRLLQVMANLLSNAVKFAGAYGEVSVWAGPLDDRVRVHVRDSGPGVPEDQHSRIFDKFTQADASSSRRAGGTGLGLNIAKKIVEHHGGRIGVQSSEQGGATFWFELPAVLPRADRRVS